MIEPSFFNRRSFLRAALTAGTGVLAGASHGAQAVAQITDWAIGPFVKREEPILRPSPESVFRCPVRGKEVRWEERNVYYLRNQLTCSI